MSNKMDKKSLCGKCFNYEGFDNGKHHCMAYLHIPPYNGIPEKFLSGEEKHTKVEEGQFMDVVYDPKDDLPIL